MLAISEDETTPDASPERSQEEDGSTRELEEGSYVIVRFMGKKTPFHYVGKCINKEGKNKWQIRYLRHNINSSSPDIITFKDPQNPDFYYTDIASIVKPIPHPQFIKEKIIFTKKDIGDISDMAVR